MEIADQKRKKIKKNKIERAESARKSSRGKPEQKGHAGKHDENRESGHEVTAPRGLRQYLDRFAPLLPLTLISVHSIYLPCSGCSLLALLATQSILGFGLIALI
jgi:hypothetical protein